MLEEIVSSPPVNSLRRFDNEYAYLRYCFVMDYVTT